MWLYRALYVVQIFILAGMVYYYFQEFVGKTAPDHAIAGESSPSIGETLRPLWGLMDKCYPVAIQRRRVRSGKKQASKATAPETPGGLDDAAPKEETDILSQGEKDPEGEGRVPGQGAASPTPAGKEVAEEKQVAGSPGWEVRRPGAPSSAGRWAGCGDGEGAGHPQHDGAKLHLSRAALCGAEGSRGGVSPGLPDFSCSEASVSPSAL
ncbi:uncharacterized protein LOC132225835 isoform X2 [Myotis daubentonii]|uniref:uncharacterized protein LOC132225835 isoform X2 n=1 Tax=Myotis daubentonii TaxID=98922 RepID=UPI002873444B|nr:uncharacterized protein LOC132225835 isoform X2 [Myotis daubentonii]